MSVFKVINSEGEKVGEIKQSELFNLPIDHKLLHRYVTWVRTMIRPTIANTKTRGDVSGGGRKPWKQKGTGRARVGSSRSPIWRKGGIVFGPTTDRNWATRMPRGERRKALMTALSAKAVGEKIYVLDSISLENYKTKSFISLINKIGISSGQKVLFVNPVFEESLFKAVSNIPEVTASTISYVNVLSIMNNDVLLMTKDTLAKFEEHFNA